MSPTNYRHFFPVFQHQPSLVYLDSAATTQKPDVIYQAITNYYLNGVANLDRGLYPLSLKATEAIQESRKVIVDFIGGSKPENLIFTAGATASINLVAQGMRHSLHPGDEIILSELEHHSNLLPWQALAAEKQLHLKFLPVNLDTGKIELGELRNLLTSSTKLVAVSHASNVLGAINDIQQLKKILQEQGSGALILLDASQTCASHFLDVENLGADFVVFSGHKMYASAGIGILWGKTPALTALSPTMLGGGTVTTATKTDSTLKELPQRLEGGTLNTEGILSLATACTFLRSLGFEAIHQHLVELSTYARSVLSTIPGLTCISPEDSYSIISFSIDGIHSHDISQACADQNICIRAGQHCTGPLHQVLNVSSTCRISFGLYSTQEDIDALVRVLTDVSMAYRA